MGVETKLLSTRRDGWTEEAFDVGCCSLAVGGFGLSWELELNVGPGFAYDDATFGQAVYAVTLSHFIPAGR
jgi:hypothetical protein